MPELSTADPVLGVDAAWTLLDANPDGMVVCDASGTIVYVNAQLEMLTGHARAGLLGQSVEVLVPTHLGRSHQAHRRHYQAAPTVRAMGEERDLSVRCRDGSHLAVEISLAPVQLDEATFTVVGVRDVTSRRANDRARRRLLALLDHVPDAVMLCRSSSESFEYVNRGAESLLGYSRAELLQMTVRHIAPRSAVGDLASTEGDLTSTEGDLASIIDESAGHEHPPITTGMRASHGLDITCEVRVVHIEEDDGHAAHVIVARDIRERLAAEQRLQSSEETFRALFEQAPVGMVLTAVDEDLTRRVLRANPAFADFVGTTVDELTGVSPMSFSHPDDDRLDEIATRAQLNGTAPSYTLEKRYRRRDGSYVWGELHSLLLSDTMRVPETTDASRIRLSHVIDIGERRAETERRDRAEQLKRSLHELAIVLFGMADPDIVMRQVAADLAGVFDAANCAVSVTAPPDEQGTRRMTARYAAGSDVSGWIVVDGAMDATPWSTTDIELLDGYAAQLGLLLEVARNRLAQQRLEVLDDRERIGRDLHDTVIQDLFALGMSLSADAGRVTDMALRAKLEGAVDDLDTAIRRLRGTVFDLNHPTRTARSLTDEVTATLREASRVLDHQPALTINGTLDGVSDAIADQLLPTVREALSNVARHARATTTHVTLTVTGDTVTLEVEDNGIGIDLTRGGGNGVVNMMQRATSLGGTATVGARPAGGTSVRWTVPVGDH